MAFQWLHRALMALACATLLAACGGGSIVDPFQPTRVVVFGDAFADLGQVESKRYTVNDGSTNIWTAQLAYRFGLSLVAQANLGGTSYATGNARVSAASISFVPSAPTVVSQVDSFLASSSVQAGDLIVLNAGIADIVDETVNNSVNPLVKIQAAGTALGDQVRRLVDRGAQHVVVVGPYNLGVSPWALQTSQTTTLQSYTAAFNAALQVSIADLGSRVLYVDAAQYFNLVALSPSTFGLTNVTALACGSAATDTGVGIGTGGGQVNSALCTGSTLDTGVDPTFYLFADRLYVTPVAHRLFGDYAYTRLKSRW